MNRPITKTSFYVLLTLALLMLALRFWRLESSPPGFFSDEAVAAGAVVCFAQTGESIFGDPYPLFFDSRIGSPVSPVFVYLGTGWMRVFGGSIAGFRGFAAFFGVLACLGAAAAAYRFRGRLAALMTLAVAALSPWAFHFSRIAWDPALAPALAVFGFVCGLRRGWGWKIAGGFLLSLSAYVYPPLRVHAPLIVLGMLVVLVRRKDLRGAGALLASALLTSLPLAWVLVFGKMLGRYGEVGVFSDYYRAQVSHWYSYPGIIVENYLQHFSPRFLFVSGDPNFRHSTQWFGELGWLDILALLAGITLLAEFLIRRYRSDREGSSQGMGIFLWCALTGFVPVAFTWEGLPHALRSISVWPFWAIIAGCLLAAFVERHPRSAPAITIVGLAFCATFFAVYFNRYPSATLLHFEVPHKEVAENAKRTGNWKAYFDSAKALPGASFYYPMEYGGLSCADVRRLLQK